MQSECKPKPQTQCKWNIAGATTRLLTLVLAFIMCFSLTVPAYAYNNVHIQTAIDPDSWEIITAVISSEVGLSDVSPEIRRMKDGELDTMFNNDSSISTSLFTSDLRAKLESRDNEVQSSNFIAGLVANIANGEHHRVLSFPTNQIRRDSSTSTDFSNAMDANNAISFDLNQAFKVWLSKTYPSLKYPLPDDAEGTNVQKFYDKMKEFLDVVSSSAGSSDYFEYDGQKYRCRIEKRCSAAEKDPEYINWSMLVYEAFYNYTLKGEEAITTDNVYTATPNAFTKIVTDFFANILNGLRGILGMWSLDELLYNDGWREKGYVGGIFPTSWEPTVWGLFLFMEIIAAMILMFGVALNLVKKAVSTMNTLERMRMMSQLQDLIVSALALALLPVLLRLAISMSGSIVKIVHEMVPEGKTINDMAGRFQSTSGSIGGVIAQFLFFGAEVYFNYYYALRALTVAVLIIMAPIMIALFAMGGKWKMSLQTWCGELMSALIIQPIHAFCITVVLILPTSVHAFDNIIAIYALIPFTSMVKSLFPGGKSNWAENAASRAQHGTTGAMAGAAKFAAGAVAAGVGGAIGAKLGMDSSGSGGSEGGSDPDGNETDGGSGSSASQSRQGNADTPEKPASFSDAITNESAQEWASIGAKVGGGIGAALGVAAGPVGIAAGAAVGAAAGNVSARALKGAGYGLSTLGKAAQRIPIVGRAAQALSSAKQAGGDAIKAIKDWKDDVKVNPDDHSAAAQVVTSVGAAALAAPKVAGRVIAGATLAAAGGLIGGYGGNSLARMGSSIIAGNDLNHRSHSAQNEESADRDQSNGGEGPDGSGPDLEQDGPDMLGQGRQVANEFDSESGEESAVYKFDQDALSRMGISDIDSGRDALEFTMQGDSAQAQEMAAYADWLDTLPQDQKRAEVEARGINATRVGDGVQVRINKAQWSAAHNGASIRTSFNPKTKESSMRVSTPADTSSLSMAGAPPRRVPVDTQAVSSYRKENAVTRLNNGTTIPQAIKVQHDLVDSGMSENGARRVADRLSTIRTLESQGYSPGEAAAQSKRLLSGAQKLDTVYIPKDDLSSEQAQTMSAAQEAGLAGETLTNYSVVVPHGKDTTISRTGESRPASFSELMNEPVSPPTSSETVYGAPVYDAAPAKVSAPAAGSDPQPAEKPQSKYPDDPTYAEYKHHRAAGGMTAAEAYNNTTRAIEKDYDGDSYFATAPLLSPS